MRNKVDIVAMNSLLARSLLKFLHKGEPMSELKQTLAGSVSKLPFR